MSGRRAWRRKSHKARLLLLPRPLPAVRFGLNNDNHDFDPIQSCRAAPLFGRASGGGGVMEPAGATGSGGLVYFGND